MDSLRQEEGCDPNPYFFPALADKLLRDYKELPIWSCLRRDHFGYRRIPASSVSVESDFNTLKTRVLEKIKTGIRIDQLVTRHLDYVNGTATILTAQPKGQKPCMPSVPSSEDGAHIPSGGEEVVKPQCIACQNGDVPAGTHRSAECSIAVHIFPECSVVCPGAEEGYGQKRICLICSEIEFARPKTPNLSLSLPNIQDLSIDIDLISNLVNSVSFLPSWGVARRYTLLCRVSLQYILRQLALLRVEQHSMPPKIRGYVLSATQETRRKFGRFWPLDRQRNGEGCLIKKRKM